MKLATTTQTVFPYVNGNAEAIRFMSQSPFKYVDYSFDGPANKTLLLTDDYLADAERSLRAAQECGMTFVQSHAAGVNPLSEDRPYSQIMTMHNRAIESCGIMGIPTIVVHAGVTYKYRNADGAYDKYRDDTIRFYSDLLPALERHKVIMLVENSCRANMGDRCFCNRGYQIAEIVDAIGSPYVKAVWDTGHANLDGSNQYDDIMALGDRLYGVHVQDNYSGRDDHLPPFTGGMDCDGLMQGLLDVGYKGYFTFEAALLRYDRQRNAPPTKFIHGNGSLRHPNGALALAELNYLYAVGKCMLSHYGCYEE